MRYCLVRYLALNGPSNYPVQEAVEGVVPRLVLSSVRSSVAEGMKEPEHAEERGCPGEKPEGRQHAILIVLDVSGDGKRWGQAGQQWLTSDLSAETTRESSERSMKNGGEVWRGLRDHDHVKSALPTGSIMAMITHLGRFHRVASQKQSATEVLHH